MERFEKIDPQIEPHELDYWSFVELAKSRLDREFEDNDAQATRLVLTLNRAASLVTYDLESTIHRPHGWSWSAFRLMFVLWLAGPMEANTAAKLTGSSRAAVSNLTTTLANKGLIAKTAGENDRRAVTLSMTAYGTADIRDVFREHNQRESTWADILTGNEQEQLVTLLEKLMASRESINAKIRR